MKLIDLRSDTVTRPTPGMLDAMFTAKVGDDVFEEDPSVNALQEKAAAMFGMEGALFCPSGTMTNQIGIKVNTNPPGEVITEKNSHVYLYEGGGIAFNSGCSVALLEGDRGRITAKQVEDRINPDNVHYPETQLVSIENTANRGGGAIYDFNEILRIAELCKAKKLRFHLDGARLFNALAETEQTPADYGKIFDTISICLSKGLGAPSGSLLLGKKDIIKHARRIRKVMGGGMRQAGYLAAAGIYALDHHVSRLKEDHARAKTLGSALSKLGYIESVLPVETNIVVANLTNGQPPQDFLKFLQLNNILAVPFGGNAIRFVTHLDIDNDAINRTIEILKKYS